MAPIQRRQVLKIGLAAATPPVWQVAAAQEKYPSKPVRIIVPLPPGGVADNSVRALTNVMLPTFGQPLLIDNKQGGAFVIATNAIKQAPADGYTLLYVHAPYLSTQAAFKKFDLFKTVVQVAGLGETDIVLAAIGKKGYATVADLIADGKANPGKLSYCSPGPGALEHLALVNFCKMTGIEAVHAPLKGGPDVSSTLISGDADFGTLAVPLVASFQAGGWIRSLIVLNQKRNAVLPDVPTYLEAKLPLSRVTLWGGLAVPIGTPPEVLAYLEKAVLAAARNPELQTQLMAAGMVPDAVKASDFPRMWRDDYVWISKTVAEAKLETN